MRNLIKIIGTGKTGREAIAWLRKANTRGAGLITASNPSKLRIKEASLAFVISEETKFPKPGSLPSGAISVAVICHRGHSSRKIAEAQDYNTTVFLNNPSYKANAEITGAFLKTLVEGISLPHLVGLDFSEIAQLLKNGRLAELSVVHSKVGNIGKAMEQALKTSILNARRKAWARVYAYFIGGADMRLEDLDKAANVMAKKLHSESDMVWGARIEGRMKGKVTVMALATQIG